MSELGLRQKKKTKKHLSMFGILTGEKSNPITQLEYAVQTD